MTPKEEAKELIGKMFSNMPKYLQGKRGSETAKQCALIDNQSTHIAIQKFLHSIARHLTGEHANQLSKEQLEKYKSIEEEIKRV
jgi:hypothetical protein